MNRLRVAANLSFDATDEIRDGHTTLHVGSASVHSDGSRRDVVIADDEHVRNLVEFGGPNAFAQLVRRLDDVDSYAGRREFATHALGLVLMRLGHRKNANLQRGQPRRKRTGIVFDENAEEAFDGSEERAVKHDRTFA